jgi:hypothetical protein
LDVCRYHAGESNGHGLSRRLRRGQDSEDGAADAHRSLRDSVVEARGPRASRGSDQLGSWWCTPTVSGSRASRGRSWRKRRPRSLRERRALSEQHFRVRRIGSGLSPERRSQGGSKVAACGLELFVGWWSSDHCSALGEGRWVIRHETTCAEPASLRIGLSLSPERRSQGGSKVALTGRNCSSDGGLRTARRRVGTTGE